MTDDRFPPDSTGRRWAMIEILEDPAPDGYYSAGTYGRQRQIHDDDLHDLPAPPPTLAEIVERLNEDGGGVEQWSPWGGRYIGTGARRYYYRRLLEEHPEWADIPQPGYRLIPREPEPEVSGWVESVIGIISGTDLTDTDLAAIADAVIEAQEAKP